MRFFKIWGPQKILCTFGDKEYASKRVSIIASDNVTSKAKLTGTTRDTVYPWGKGINKQKTNKQIKCVCLVKSAVYDVGQQGVLGIVQIEDKQQSDAKCLQSYTRCITQAFASNRRTPTVRLGSRP